jgi:PAS domain S-box-containing protein
MWYFPKPKLRSVHSDDIVKRTGFLTRLGNLIILQALFVFAAIGLILFYPNANSPDGKTDAQSLRVVADLGQRMMERFEPADGLAGNLGEKKFRSELQLSSAGISSAALFVVNGDGTVQCLQAIGSEIPTFRIEDITEGSARISEELLRHVAVESPGFILSSILNSEQNIVYYRPHSQNNLPTVVAATVSHDLLISRRSEVTYALLLLFLVAVLLSLLTIYFIWKRFRQPLVHLIRRLEKTADGEVYYQLETEGDIELNVLSNTFNRMTKTLWSNQQEMKTYNSRLREINASLLQSRMFLATLIDSSPSAIVVTAKDGQVIIFNREAVRSFGYTSDEALGQNVSDLFKQPFIATGAQDGDKPGFEAIGMKHDGTAFPVWVVMTPTRSDEGEVWASVYIIHDITESTSFQEMMIRLDRYSTRGEMAGDIAHEINNYLAVLSGNLELLPLLLKKGDPEKIAKKLELMRHTVDRVARFADGLMDTNRDESTPEPTSLNQVVENVVAFLRPQNKFDTVNFQTVLSSDLPFIEVDPGQVQQLMVNLINNGTDAAIAAGVKPNISITTSLTTVEGRRFAQVAVADNGDGVSEEKIEALFARRFTTKRKGHGIGLITCKRIMDAHQGDVSYHYSGGAVFTCRFPYERIATNVELEPTPPKSSETVRA